jgi:hypothetical protein
VTAKGDLVKVSGAKVVTTDIVASNGIIHVIDTVMLPPEPQPTDPRIAMRNMIELAIDRGVPLFNAGHHAACAAIYEVAAKGVLTLRRDQLPDGTAEKLQSALSEVKSQTTDATANAWTLRRALDSAYASLTRQSPDHEAAPKRSFIREAKLPAGFPEPGAVGEIMVKEYPAYRMAEASTSDRDRRAFMRLFVHIKRARIKMTAPVEVLLSYDGRSRTAMRFLYAQPTLGQTGAAGHGVRVADEEGRTVVSVGLRGEVDEATRAETVARLREWIKSDVRYRSAGAPRQLSYNSPMVPRDRRYSEIQIPIEPTILAQLD